MWRHRDTGRPCEDWGKDYSDAATVKEQGYQKLKEASGGPSPKGIRENTSDTLISDSSLQKSDGINLFKPASLRDFATVALWN